MGLGDKIRRMRKVRDWTQEELARLVGVERATIAGYETREKHPSYEVLKKLARVFGVSIDHLLDYQSEADSQQQNEIRKITEAVKEDPELLDFWKQLLNRDDLQLLFRQTKDLSPEAIKFMLRSAKIFEEEEKERHNS